MADKILILDDDPHLGQNLCAFFRNKDVDCVLVSNIEEAERETEKTFFPIAMVDLVLGESSGFQFIERYKDRYPDSEIIIITGREMLADAQKAIRLKVFDFIVKPFRLKTVWQSVQNALKHFEIVQKEKRFNASKAEYAQRLEQQVREKTETLKKTARFYKKMAYDIPFGIVLIVDEKVSFINKMALELTGREAFDGHIMELVHESKQKSFKRVMQETLKRQKPLMLRFRILTRSASQKELPVRGLFYPMDYYDEKGVIVFFSDQSPLLESRHKEQLYKNEYFKEYNLSLIGQLASGIAHNLNTPLSIIQGNAELLSLRYPDLEETRMILRQTEHMGRQIANLIKKGKNELTREQEELDLNQLITDEIEFARANLYFKHYITTRLDLTPDLPLIYGVYYDFSVCLSALIQNAVDAMFERDERTLTVRTAFDDDYIRCDITDTGIGIPPENHRHIFEPFFSTKPDYTDTDIPVKMPRGNGLGLNLVMDVVEHYNLQLTFESVPEKGTTFTLKFPRRKRDHSA